MSEIARASLFGKLNGLGYKAIESATVFCKLRGNPYVELVHWFNQILQLSDSDLHHILHEFHIDPSRLARDMTAALDQLPRGATSISDLSSHVEEAVERGWVYGTLLFGEPQVRTGHLVVGILKTPGLRHALSVMSREFDKVKVEQLTDGWRAITNGSPEETMVASDGFRIAAGVAPGESSGAIAPAVLGKQEALRRFSVDLTERARNGEMDPIVGRDEEIRQIVDILMRRRQNNPILTGEAGVGKTAVVEGFAQRIASGDVPPPLRNVSLRALDIGLLQAGASMKGEFESRLRQVIDEVQASAQPIILFIDEAHTLIGAGGAAGTGDAANLLKPALARGKLRTIAATTWAEYKKHIEKDPALTRRFQVVQVGEPDEAKALLMMRGTAAALEKHHRVLVLDEALEAAVKLSHRYIPARQLPDKAVSLLDTSCARVAISQHAVPAEVDDSRRCIQAFETEIEIIRREAVLGMADATSREELAQEKLRTESRRLADLEERWAAEKKLVDQVLDLRGKLRGNPEAVERAAWLDELHAAQAKLVKLQGEQPLILPTVDEQAVASVVGDWTGIPVGRMVKNEIETVLKLAGTLGQRVLGQGHALDMIARRIQTSRAGIENPNKPIGVFMLAGPSGVGKTETALALAETLYGGEQNAITINMSEFQEAHTVSTLKGAPPGYVGYGEGGVLTEAVRRRPYSVVLLDEVEKAHPDVHEIFFQVFDKGWMEDGEGRVIDFKNTLILLTTNVGSELILGMCQNPAARPDPESIAQSLRKPLLRSFPAALLGRIVTIPYYPLDDEMIGNIVRLQLGRVAKRVHESHRIPFSYDDAVVKLIANRCTELESGGRMIDSILTNTLLPRISHELLSRMMQGKSATRVGTTVTDGELQYAFD
jgi:type VI secretion system protein VasG